MTSGAIKWSFSGTELPGRAEMHHRPRRDGGSVVAQRGASRGDRLPRMNSVYSWLTFERRISSRRCHSASRRCRSASRGSGRVPGFRRSARSAARRGGGSAGVGTRDGAPSPGLVQLARTGTSTATCAPDTACRPDGRSRTRPCRSCRSTGHSHQDLPVCLDTRQLPGPVECVPAGVRSVSLRLRREIRRPHRPVGRQRRRDPLDRRPGRTPG
jgi:hypothetical protein